MHATLEQAEQFHFVKIMIEKLRVQEIDQKFRLGFVDADHFLNAVSLVNATSKSVLFLLEISSSIDRIKLGHGGTCWRWCGPC